MRLNTAQRLALNIDAHIAIDAGAGTGKTSTIIRRVIQHYLATDQRATRLLPTPKRPSKLQGGMISSPASERIDPSTWGGLLPGEVVLLTFTKSAAEELKDKLRKELSELHAGPIGERGSRRRDPRIANQGTVEVLQTLLEDAPIGTIDSFFKQLIAPYLSMLGDEISPEIVSDAQRILLTDLAFNTLWRLPNSTSQIGNAVDAGIPAEIATEVLESRDRISVHYSGRKAAAGVLRTLINNSVFVKESGSRISDGDNISADLVKKQIIQQINPESVTIHANEVHSILNRFCELVKTHLPDLAKGGWPSKSRMACLDSLCKEAPPQDTWEQLIWLSHTLICTLNPSSVLKKKELALLPGGCLPSDKDWEAGIERFSAISDVQTRKKVRKSAKEISDDLRVIWEANDTPSFCPLMLHFSQIALLLSDVSPPAIPDDWPHLSPIPNPVPERVDDPLKYYFTMDAEVRNLQDLYLVHHGFMKILENLKKREGSFDFEDIQRMAGDFLLANCPDACRSFYPSSIQSALDSISDNPWRDDHIHAAFFALERLENDPIKAGEAASNLGAIRSDLEKRFELLKIIRRRYRAFIFDEAQDNSPVQWRLLSRLWGERYLEKGEPNIPDTPWQPTVCYVGDMKQSIYAFRQAEVSGFQEYVEHLMTINDHEIQGIKELARSPALRRNSHSRDPRNAHPLTIASASEYMEKGGRDLVAWIPFDATDRNTPVPSGRAVEDRKRGLITLQVNYRTSGDLLRTMNECWEDIFSERYRHLPNADFYATSQTLFACPEKDKLPGSLEWICPQNDDDRTNPSIDLDIFPDPFNSGIPNPLERQAMVIALRVRSLVNGSPVRLKSAKGDWYRIDAEDPVSPSDIMILLPSRTNLRDTITRHLNNLGIPYHADQEGGLFDRPAAQAIEGLLQFIARPKSRHHATRVARSVLIGMDDESLQNFIGRAERGEDLLHRLIDHCSGETQKAMVTRWCKLSEAGRLLDLLDETTDRSDLLVAHPRSASRQAVEQVIDIVRNLANEVGGDPVVIADNIRTIRESSSNAVEAPSIPHGEAVRVMTIHKAKGLESKVVLIADVFSSRQTTLRNDFINRMIVSPELFAGHPKPWPGKPPHSALWDHVLMVHRARKMAEARRLLYVGATRAKEKLIFAGSPISPLRTRWEDNQGLWIPWDPNWKVLDLEQTPTLGQMWIASMHKTHYRNQNPSSPPSSPWVSETGGVPILDPVRMLSNYSLGENTLRGIQILHHPECFVEEQPETKTPLQIIKQLCNTARSADNSSIFRNPRKDSETRIRISPNRLPVFQDCSRRQWFETIGGLRPDPIVPDDQVHTPKGMPKSVDPATFGTIFHRILEIGIGNPGIYDDSSSPPLPLSWTEYRENQISNPEIHSTVFRELLPPEADVERTRLLVAKIAETLQSGPLGRMVEREPVNGHWLEGLRTEMPFHITIDVDTGGLVTHRWSPQGNEPLANIDQAKIEMSGIIDLVLCTKTSDGDYTIRAVDLKTEDAGLVNSASSEGLFETLDSEETGPACDAEFELLRKHRMQLALYYQALQSIENTRMEAGLSYRTVLPPAILVGVTGRMVEYPVEMLDLSLQELDELLVRTAKMTLSTDAPLSDYDRLPTESVHVCETCPFHRGALPICGPAEQ